jgi:hypothetical protein
MLTGGFFFFSPESLLKLSIAVSDMALRAKARAAGDKWMPEEQLWYMRYGKITGTGKYEGSAPDMGHWLNSLEKTVCSNKARELGINHSGFGSLANHKQEKWKTPLADFIEELYFKRFRKEHPGTVQK